MIPLRQRPLGVGEAISFGDHIDLKMEMVAEGVIEKFNVPVWPSQKVSAAPWSGHGFVNFCYINIYIVELSVCD